MNILFSETAIEKLGSFRYTLSIPVRDQILKLKQTAYKVISLMRSYLLSGGGNSCELSL
ncbi:MAG: hypothetical protein PVI26_11855 [Chitinispirillia bacterium]